MHSILSFSYALVFKVLSIDSGWSRFIYWPQKPSKWQRKSQWGYGFTNPLCIWDIKVIMIFSQQSHYILNNPHVLKTWAWTITVFVSTNTHLGYNSSLVTYLCTFHMLLLMLVKFIFCVLTTVYHYIPQSNQLLKHGSLKQWRD